MSSEFLARAANKSRSIGRPALVHCFLVCALLGSIKAEANPIRRVLVLYEVGSHYPAIAMIDQAISDKLRNSSYPIEIYREYLDTALFPDPSIQQEFRDWYTRKYRDRKPDVIIAVGPSPLEFMLAAHETFFRDIPVVFCTSPEEVANRARLDSHFTGMWDELEPVKALETSLRLRPGTKHVFLVGGTSPYDRSIQRLYRERLHDYESKLDLTYLTGLTMPQLLDTLRHLPDRSVVLHLSILRDAAGKQFLDATEAGPMVAQAANAPVFTYSTINLGHGEAGGYLINVADEGKIAAGTAVRILGGEKPADIPITKTADVYMFDSRVLKRWGIKERDLPPGSIVLNRQPSFWELYKWYVISGISLILVEWLLIVALLWHRRRRDLAERRLRENEVRLRLNEERLRLAVGAGKMLAYSWDALTDAVERSGGYTDILGPGTPQKMTGAAVFAMVHPEDKEKYRVALAELSVDNPFLRITYRVIRSDGAVVWLQCNSRAYFNQRGELDHLVGIIADVTEKKLSEGILRGISRRLIQAQEEERTRIARELHDDINQRLAMLQVELSQIQDELPDSPPAVREHLDRVCDGLAGTSEELQAISHRLHSSKLEYLGLVTACKAFCREVGGRHKVQIGFQDHGVPSKLPQDVSLAIFRVLQESLQNSIKYSQAEHFDVQLHGKGGEIELTVRDDGIGFDVGTVMSCHGLGLISMRERASLVGGTIVISSQPTHGTEVKLRVPAAVAKDASNSTLSAA
jgi:PAS domain S-box-containing protein